jgi:hypothetical protein
VFSFFTTRLGALLVFTFICRTAFFVFLATGFFGAFFTTGLFLAVYVVLLCLGFRWALWFVVVPLVLGAFRLGIITPPSCGVFLFLEKVFILRVCVIKPVLTPCGALVLLTSVIIDV